MNSVRSIVDYIVLSCSEAGVDLSLLKLQKLLYYAQGWHLAFFRIRLFEGTFQAWVHGPVNRETYNRFAGEKTLYSSVDHGDITSGFNPDKELTPEARLHINSVLEIYAKLSGSQLEELTHTEDPWIIARGNCPPAQRCENEISDMVMADYYGKRISGAA